MLRLLRRIRGTLVFPAAAISAESVDQPVYRTPRSELCGN